MFSKAKQLFVVPVLLVAFLAVGAFTSTSSAFAYGQCGGAVSSGGAIYKSWQSMGVVPQAQEVVKSAGFHRMDGSLKSWMEERVIEAPLASSASPVDFGCQPGSLFSVGNRPLAKGTQVLVAIPLKYAKTDIRSTPHKGYKRIVIEVHLVGKTDCSNPLEGVVRVVVYIKVTKHHPKSHPPKKHKCGCHKKKPKPVVTCAAKGLINGPNGTCVNQTATTTTNPKQECEASDHSTTGCTQTTTVTVVQVNCGNYSSGNTGTLEQKENCTQKTEETCTNNSCNVTPPPKEECGCKPEEPEKPKTPEQPVVEWERVQEVYTGHERKLSVTVTPNSVVSSVQFGVKWGERSNGGVGVYNASTNKYSVNYTAPTEEPPHTCEEAISSSLPAGTKCDIVNVAVYCNNGAKMVTAKMEIPIIKEESQVTW